MKKLLIILIILTSTISYSQSLQQIREDNVVLDEGIDSDGDYYITVVGEGIYTTLTYYYNNPEDGYYILMIQSDIKNTSTIIRRLNKDYIKIDTFEWIDSKGLVSIRLFIKEEFIYMQIIEI